MNISCYIVKKEVFERIRVICPASEGQAVLAEIHERGYRTIQSGAYTNKAMFPRCDDTRRLFIAERPKQSE